MKLVLSPRARDDLFAIGRYTAKTWGRKQAQTYLMKLRARLQWITENPNLGRMRDDIAPAYFGIAEGSHIIFYQLKADTIQVLGIPHASMDLPAFFGDRDPKP